MHVIFDALPGLEVPVGEIARSLGGMWRSNSPDETAAPTNDEAKATQVNLVLHFGFNTTAEDALAQFQTAVRFSQRYPSRIVVLCPMADSNDQGKVEMRSKIYGECHLGKSKSDRRCVEFVILCYSRAARVFLESEVSICLSTDLPLYYWAHRFSASAKLADYRFLLGRSKRVLIDTSTAPADVMDYPWPNPLGLRDLVYSRLLPVRQTVGQFLSSYLPGILIEGLGKITVRRGEELAAEGTVLSNWLRRRLTACGLSDLAIGTEASEPGQLGITFAYADPERFFRWRGNLQTSEAQFECNFGLGATKLAASVSLLAPENALSEAMFL